MTVVGDKGTTMPNMTKHFGEMVADLRRGKGWQQAQLAREAGIGTSAVGRIELAQIHIAYDKGIQVMAALKPGAKMARDLEGALGKHISSFSNQLVYTVFAKALVFLMKDYQIKVKGLAKEIGRSNQLVTRWRRTQILPSSELMANLLDKVLPLKFHVPKHQLMELKLAYIYDVIRNYHALRFLPDKQRDAIAHASRDKASKKPL
jgi:transcriptional regulator with XRE-family HTH domain